MATTPAPETPQTWHHGLVAKWWSEFRHDGPEIAYFQGFIQDGGEPASGADPAVGIGIGALSRPAETRHPARSLAVGVQGMTFLMAWLGHR